MSTITITPRKAPIVLAGDFDVVEPEMIQFGQSEEDTERELIRTHSSALQFRGLGADITFVSDNPLSKENTRNGVLDDRRAYYRRQYGCRITYHNYTNQMLVIVERMGLPLVLLPDARTPETDTPSLVIRHELHFDNKEAMQRTLAALKHLAPIQGRELSKVQDVLRREVRYTGGYGARAVLEYRITEEELLEAPDRTVYHHKADVVISLNGIEDPPRHPASSEYVQADMPWRNTAPTCEDDIGVMLRYVSNDPEATPKYMRFANKVFTLKPQADHPSKLLAVAQRDKRATNSVLEDRYDYIEFLYPARIDTNDPKTAGVRCTRIPLDEARSLYGIFDTYQDVTNPHDALETANRRLKDKLDFTEQENKRLTREFTEKLADKDREYLQKIKDLETGMADLKREQAIKIEQLKEQREGQSHRQKVNFELAKFLMNLVAIVLGLIPLFMKAQAATAK